MKGLVFLFCIFFPFLSFGQTDTIVVRDLRLDWKGVDSEGNVSALELSKSEVVIFQVPNDTSYQLRVLSENPIDFWVNDQLVYHNFQGIKVFSLIGLKSKFGKIDRISIYERGGLTNVKTEIIQVVKRNILWNPLPKSHSVSDDAFLLQLLGLVFLAAIFYRLDRDLFKGYLSLLRLRKSTLDDNTELYNQSSTLKVVFLSFLAGTFMSYLDINIFGLVSNSILNSLGSWLLNSFFLLVLILIKQIYTVGLSKVYGFRRVAALQLNGYSNFLILAGLPCLAFLLLDFIYPNTDGEQMKVISLGIIVAVTLLIQLWAFLKLDNHYADRKLMIFTYLCTSELAPGFLVLYWLDKIS